jgi:hypothetical protein
MAARTQPRCTSGRRPRRPCICITNSSFENNTNAVPDDGGGAVHVFRASLVFMDGCNFTDNRAQLGGAIFVASGGWLARLSGSRFERNRAEAYGGAMFLQAQDCYVIRDAGGGDLMSVDNGNCWISIDRLTAVNNFAADGGALYFDSAPDLCVNLTGVTFVGNEARGDAAHDVVGWGTFTSPRDRWSCNGEHGALASGWGGAVYLGSNQYQGVSFFEDAVFERNRAARGGGAMHACSLSPTASMLSTLALKRATLTGNWAGGRLGEVAADSTGGALNVVGAFLEVRAPFFELFARCRTPAIVLRRPAGNPAAP